jgi:hypothetical protein
MSSIFKCIPICGPLQSIVRKSLLRKPWPNLTAISLRSSSKSLPKVDYGSSLDGGGNNYPSAPKSWSKVVEEFVQQVTKRSGGMLGIVGIVHSSFKSTIRFQLPTPETTLTVTYLNVNDLCKNLPAHTAYTTYTKSKIQDPESKSESKSEIPSISQLSVDLEFSDSTKQIVDTVNAIWPEAELHRQRIDCQFTKSSSPLTEEEWEQLFE